MDKPKTRENGQVKQPGIEYEPEGNGWPEPLVDASDKLTCTYTVGKSGTVEGRDVTKVKNDE
jgi:hypothetical protein